ncbi:MAG TPA: stimulus-sensing domain-containing protein, partial [Allosphingosinicella sp.]
MARNDEKDLDLKWSGRWMLLHRILAVNIFALAVLAGSIFYLDSFRARLTAGAVTGAETQAGIMADSLALAEPGEKTALLHRLGARSRTRLRVFGPDGALRMDSWNAAPPTYELRDPATEPWRKSAARLLDNLFDAVAGKPPALPLTLPEPERLEGWSEAAAALNAPRATSMLRRAPEGTLFISAASRIPATDDVLLLTRNARDIRSVVRDERRTLLIVIGVTLIMSVLLSLFLARTIALPLRRLARAAHQVRLGRAREVSVPTLPARRDEIGLLARALSDMTQSLRYRIDATEAFAADVTHELK